MAHSIQTVGDQALILHDLDLLAVMALIKETISRLGVDCAALLPYLDWWNQGCLGYGPGTIDLKLEEVLGRQSTKLEFERLLASITESLKERGDTVSEEFLSCWCRVQGISFSNYPTARVKTTVESLRKFCSDVVTPNE